MAGMAQDSLLRATPEQVGDSVMDKSSRPISAEVRGGVYTDKKGFMYLLSSASVRGTVNVMLLPDTDLITRGC